MIACMLLAKASNYNKIIYQTLHVKRVPQVQRLRSLPRDPKDSMRHKKDV